MGTSRANARGINARFVLGATSGTRSAMETTTQYLARSLHDIGAAAWFGGSLMGAIGLNGAAAHVSDEKERLLVADAGWARWTPVNLVGIGAHLLGSAMLLKSNRARIANQQGVGKASLMKTAVTVGALGITAYSRTVGKKLEQAGRVPVAGPTDPNDETPEDVASAQRQQKILQWAVPALSGAAIVVSAMMSEQQRSQHVLAGVARRVLPGT